VLGWVVFRFGIVVDACFRFLVQNHKFAGLVGNVCANNRQGQLGVEIKNPVTIISARYAKLEIAPMPKAVAEIGQLVAIHFFGHFLDEIVAHFYFTVTAPNSPSQVLSNHVFTFGGKSLFAGM